jgi:hypothetical protein
MREIVWSRVMNSIRGWFAEEWLVAMFGAVAVGFVLIFIWPSPAGVFVWNHLTDKSGALAAWVAAIATVALVYGLAQTKRSMKASAQSTVFQRTYEQFNAPNMLHARAVFAKTHLDRIEKGGIDEIVRDNYVPLQGWQVINFLNLVGHLVQTEELNLRDVELAYATHVQMIWARWKEQLTPDYRENRYKPFLDLYDKINASPQPKAVKGELELRWKKAQEPFWLSEAALDPNAKSEDDK